MARTPIVGPPVRLCDKCFELSHRPLIDAASTGIDDSNPAFGRPRAASLSGYDPGCEKTRAMVGFSCGIAARFEGWIDENNGFRVTDDVVDGLGLAVLGFDRVQLKATGRPSYDPWVLRSHIYGRAK